MNRWWKRGVLLAIMALLVAPLSAYAAEADSDSYKLDVATEVEGNNLTITATIEGAESAESGEWKIIPVGPNTAGNPATENQSSELTFSHTWNDLEPGKYCFKVQYTGKLDGSANDTVLHLKKKDKVCATVEGSEEPKDEDSNEKEEPSDEEEAEGEEPGELPVTECTNFENISEEDFHEISIDLKDSGDTIKVIATLPGKTAEGVWELMAGHWDAEEPDIYETKVSSETSLTFSIPKNKLTDTEDYLIFIVFSGTIDGKDCQWGLGFDGFFLEDEEEGTIAPPTKKVPKPTTPEGKERAIKNAKGGKMPNTSASMVTNIAFGALLMITGAGLLAYRRFTLS